MTYDEFMDKIEELNEDTDAVDIYCSEDFQCDQTGGFPTMLCVNWDKGKAWLQLNDFLIEATEMCSRITKSGSYSEALGIIGEYVNITDGSESEDDDFDEDVEGMGMRL